MPFFSLVRILFPVLILPVALAAQKPQNTMVAGIPVNYNEDSVGTYVLPDPLTLQNGQKVKDAATWLNKRRPEILRLYEENQFGRVPPAPKKIDFEVYDKGTPAYGGKALRKQIRVFLSTDTAGPKMDLLVYLPIRSDKPMPLLLNVSFSANSSMVADSGIRPSMIWTRTGTRAVPNASPLGNKLDVLSFVTEGIGVATVYYGDIEPDFKAGITLGIRNQFLQGRALQANEWGAISAWSWGLSRALDYFEKEPQIDAKRVALFGASRLGKTVLWTGARDTRFALVIGSCSGEGGAAISRRNYGETVAHITDTSRYFYQFAPRYHDYSNKIDEYPLDGHMLVSLMAPRPVLLQTGDEDYWSDPVGEYVAAKAALPVFALFGKNKTNLDTIPTAGDKSQLFIPGYYMHKGGHGTIPSDWPVFVTYLKRYL